MSLVSFIGPKPNLLGIDELNPPLRLEVGAAGARFLRDGEDPPHRALHRRQVQGLRARHHLSGRLGQGGGRGAARLARRAGRGRGALGLFDHRHLRPAGRHANASRFRRCSRSRRSTSTWWARGCAPAPGLVVETGSAREVHHFALLGGYGAEAVHPYLALETLLALHPHRPASAATKAIKNYVKAIGKGLKKVMSKMGISTYMSYTGSQIFEAVGLAKSLVEQVLHRHRLQHRGHRRCSRSPRRRSASTAPRSTRTIPCSKEMLDAGGEYAWRVRGEEHTWTPRRDRQAAAVDARQLLRDLQGIRAAHQRPVAAPHDVPRAVRVPLRRAASRCRSRRSSRRPRSSSASPPARCRSARSRPRRTPRSPSP